MKKSVKVLIGIILTTAVVAACVGTGYLIKQKWWLDTGDKPPVNETVATAPSTEAGKTDIDEEKIYTDYLNSAEAEKYYHLLEDDGDEGFKYSGKKEVEFFDIDGDGVSECLVRIKYHYAYGDDAPVSDREEQVCLFDIVDKNVRLVKSTGLCAPYRAGEKVRLVKTEDNTYKLFWYVCDSNKIRKGSVYTYDSKNLSLDKSFFADIYPFIYDEKTYFISDEYDLFDETAENFADYDKYGEKISEEEFFEQWDYYESNAVCVYQSPEHTEPV